MDSADEEMVEVLDDDGAVIDTVSRREMRERNLRHRSVLVAVVNDADEILVHKRASWKDVWPDRWDVAVGGVVDPGEAWEAAAAREMVEETGAVAELGYLGEDRYDDDEVRVLARIYHARTPGPFSFDDGEIVDAVWVPITQLRDWLADKPACPDSLALVLPRLDSP
ncbi:NUDIX hydrolase [Rhabdothermincola salaria]|uniref:NUDIX hydrolase n=1 Tax=Rhabdothermincola salaria TaxID=2903142 RepID=UPI001E39E78A|nr:NUDIX domain-containing protein [Rhabdothermincola salaria]MCD9623526.1 NUDIX domain-containing protein [Rhabdothermincola salaria]